MTRFNKSKTKKTITKYRQNKKFETIYGTKSLDQIQKDIKNNTTELNENIYYCIECSRNLNTERDFMAHKKTTTHKRRVKMLKEIQHTQKDAEMAADLMELADSKIEKEMPNQLEYDEKSDEKVMLKLERIYHIFIKIKELQDWIRE
ncbi:hypothetical protein CWI36_0641p0020 [Hamiltosporidium magnivora]|uniref:C2H2-type domain-containing protein n=1 Tax=Hamiltosporidium magnivora TaxID=148818 RepID=A0A4Q9LC10_9MICR|nr:hypothetical protein CWI36_0641p0020 [Hamiltosporidium magnivora]